MSSSEYDIGFCDPVAHEIATSDNDPVLQHTATTVSDAPMPRPGIRYDRWAKKKNYERVSEALETCSNQFGFKAKHSTDMCILAFKEAILKYRDLSSNVYTCFLDASKAFDRVNHFKLFTTLSKRNVPMYIIRILIFWYTSQTMYVRWNNTMSTGFNVSNGVRQGGILSPYLFCIYVDELSKMLNNVHVGCFVGTMLVNH